MIEIAVVAWLCSKNWHKALEKGHRPAGYVFLTIALWLGMEFIGLWLGLLCGAGIGAYLFGLLFAAAGGYVSYTFTANLRQGDYKPKAMAKPFARSARITVERQESNGDDSFAVWDFFLNGENIGSIEDGGSITALTSMRNNMLEAKDPSGALNQAFVFFVKSGWHLKVCFEGGRFQNAQRLDAPPPAGSENRAAQGAPR